MDTQQLAKKLAKEYMHPVFSNYAASKSGEIINIKSVKKLHPAINCKSGYCQINVYDKSLEKPKKCYVHRFIWESIKGKIPNDLEVNHIKEIKTDNRQIKSWISNASEKYWIIKQ